MSQIRWDRASCYIEMFVRGRVLALLGYEIVEGSLKDGRILETRRVNYAPQRTQVRHRAERRLDPQHSSSVACHADGA